MLISKEITAHLCHDHMASPGSGEGKLNVKRARKKRISQNTSYTTLSVSLSFVYLYKRIMDFFAAGCSIFAPYDHTSKVDLSRSWLNPARFWAPRTCWNMAKMLPGSYTARNVQVASLLSPN